MINRSLTLQFSESLDHAPATALLGPDQVGKTTLALALGEQHRALY